MNSEVAECSLFVEAGHRHRGIGTELFQITCAAAKELGGRTLTILVTRGDLEMLDLAVRMEGISTFRHGTSMILPGDDHGNARWLAFDIDSILQADSAKTRSESLVGQVRGFLHI